MRLLEQRPARLIPACQPFGFESGIGGIHFLGREGEGANPEKAFAGPCVKSSADKSDLGLSEFHNLNYRGFQR